MVKKTIYNKSGSKWIQGSTIFDSAAVYDSLSHDLVAKKMRQCGWIKSIKYNPLYNGFSEVIVSYTSTCKAVYTITSH